MEDTQLLDAEELFMTLNQALVDSEARPEMYMSAAARALCLMALAWRPADASAADARQFVFSLVDRNIELLRQHPLAQQGIRH